MVNCCDALLQLIVCMVVGCQVSALTVLIKFLSFIVKSVLAHFVILKKGASTHFVIIYVHVCPPNIICVCVCPPKLQISTPQLQGQLAFAFKRTIMRKCALCDSPP